MKNSKTNLRKNFLLIRKKKYLTEDKFNFNLILQLIKKHFQNKKIIIGGYYPSNYEVNLINFLKIASKKNYKITLPVIKNSTTMCFKSWTINQPLYVFLKKKWYFDELYDLIFVRSFKFIGKFFWKKIDGSVIDRFGPDGISNFIKYLSNKAVKFQNGFLYQYAFVMLIGFSILLTILIVK